jgi:hypothetical protein
VVRFLLRVNIRGLAQYWPSWGLHSSALNSPILHSPNTEYAGQAGWLRTPHLITPGWEGDPRRYPGCTHNLG